MEILVIIVLLAGTVIGFCQGAFKQIANFIGVALGLFLASTLYQQFGDYLAAKSGASESIGHTIAFVLIVVLVPILLGWMASLLTKLFSAVKLGFVNRVCGAFIGACCYGMLLSFAFNFMDFLTSNCGFNHEKLEERQEIFYKVKHVAQPVIPNFVIVTDSTEEANGEEPRRGIKTGFDNAVNKAVDGMFGK